MIKHCIKLVLVMLILHPQVSQAQKVIRGPYLQRVTSSSIIVCWRTDTITNSKVYYGTKLDSLTEILQGTISTSEHRAPISGLTPFTKYYYAIGNDNGILSGSDSMQFFVTAPLPDTEQPIRIWTIGDFGRGNAGEREVRDSYIDYAGDDPTDVWLWVGDNVYTAGTDQEWQDKVFDSIYGYHEFFKYNTFWASPGNHDYEVISPIANTVPPENHTGPYYDIIEAPTNGEAGGVASTYELYYSFDYGNVHFISLNSELGSLFTPSDDWTGANLLSTFNGSPMSTWLEADLQANNKMWTIAYWHQPPYSKADGTDSDNAIQRYMIAMRENFVPILEQYGVDLVLCGHSHTYQRSFLIDGHYGDSGSFDPATMAIDTSSGNYDKGTPYLKKTTGPDADKGTVYVVIGNCGGDDDLLPQKHPVMYFAEGGPGIFGSFILDIDGNRLDGKYLRSNTGEILDEFTIIKADSLSTFIDEPDNQFIDELNVFPNPFKKGLNIEFNLKKKSSLTLAIYNINGQRIQVITEGVYEAGLHKFAFDGDRIGLSKGQYLLQLTTDDEVRFKKVVKFN